MKPEQKQEQLLTENATFQKEKGLMIEGVIWKQLLFFSVPLIIGNLFQQLYNAVDSIVVGNFVGGTALAAVGAGSAIINLLIGLFMGITTGASVVISQFYGAKDKEKVQQAVHTTVAFTMLFSLFMTALGIFLTDPILRWTLTPDSVFPQASLYLKIFFSGTVFLMLYNCGAAILRAVGDSKTPLYYLGVACLVNIVLDVVFVTVFSMGVAGVAVATIIAQALASFLVMRKLVRAHTVYGLTIKKIALHGLRLKQILYVGIPTGLQQMIISLSNVIVQGYVNTFGENAMAGWGAYGKLDGFLLLPVASFGLAMTTFTGQNIGANRSDRVHRGVKSCMLMSCTYGISSTILVYTFGRVILQIFTKEPNVLHYGVYMLRGMIPFYFLLAIIQVLCGTISGAGYALYSMLIMVGNMCVLRVLMLMLLSPVFDTMDFIFYAYIISWFTAVLCLALYYRGFLLPKVLLKL